MRVRIVAVSATLAFIVCVGAACTPGPTSTSPSGSASSGQDDGIDPGIAVTYSESPGTAPAEGLARWATDNLLTDLDSASLLDVVSGGGDPYPGSATVSTLLAAAHAQQEKAAALYQDGKFTKGDAEAKRALASIEAAEKLMESDFNAALAKASPGTIYALRGGNDAMVTVKGGSLESPAVVVKWIDGDTVLTDKGEVRLVGMDAPEVSDTCSTADQATQHATDIAPPGSTVVLRDPLSVQDKDRYRRLLRYVETNPQGGAPAIDVGYAQIRAELAVARYDGLDGFASHPRQDPYRAESQSALARDVACYPPLIPLFGDGDDGRADKNVLTKQQKRTSHDLLENDWKYARSTMEDALREDRSYWTEYHSSEATSEDGGSGAPPGYTGPRCYAPGGKTWRPC